MGKVKDKLTEIEEYLINGYDVEDIALILDVPLDWIYEAVKRVDVEYNHTEFGKLE